MKKIMLDLLEASDLLHKFFNHKSDANIYLDAIQQENLERDFKEYMLKYKLEEKKNFVSDEELRTVANPLIKYLCEKHHPHVTAIVTGTSIELFEGIKCIHEIYDFLID